MVLIIAHSFGNGSSCRSHILDFNLGSDLRSIRRNEWGKHAKAGQLAFDGGFEDGSFVAFEVGLDALEIGDGFVEAGELFFDFRDDELLLASFERKR